MKLSLPIIFITLATTGCVPKSEHSSALSLIKEKDALVEKLTTQVSQQSTQLTGLSQKLDEQKSVLEQSNLSLEKANAALLLKSKEIEEMGRTLNQERLKKEVLEKLLKGLSGELTGSYKELRKLSSALEDKISRGEYSALHRSVKVSIQDILDSSPENSKIAVMVKTTLNVYTGIISLFDTRDREIVAAKANSSDPFGQSVARLQILVAAAKFGSALKEHIAAADAMTRGLKVRAEEINALLDRMEKT